MNGHTVSHYRIFEQIGGGGMGVVYRAEDLRLGRRVALKFLPAEFVKDPVMLERFHREARAASAINHPNICTIYDIGEDDEGRPFLCMEYLEGSSLRDVLAERPVPIDSVLAWGQQIADALDAAHARGIVHRDLKPANLFITNRGQAKILDFGLAKLASEPALTAPSDLTATLTRDFRTTPGTTVGTVSYMSPEQASGEALDARTDIFSLGVVLYEMATGQRPFEGRTTALIFQAILSRKPEVPSMVNNRVPADLDAVLLRCLEKNPEKRYQSATELAGDLQRLQRESATGLSVASGGRRLRKRTPVPWAGWVIAVVILAMIVGPTWFWLGRSGQPSRQPSMRRITANPSDRPVTGAIISPDGRFIAWSDLTGIRLQNLRTGDTKFLPGTGGMNVWGWTAGSEKLLAIRQSVDTEPQQFSVDLFGGLAIEPVDWSIPSPDGTRAIVWRPGGEQWLQDAGGGHARLLLKDNPRHIARSVWSPDSKRLAILRQSTSGEALEHTLLVQDAAGGAMNVVAGPSRAPLTSVAWAGSNRLIYTAYDQSPRESDSNLWTVHLNPDGTRSAEPVRLTSNAGFSFGFVSTTPDGKRAALIRTVLQTDVYIADLDAVGAIRGEPRRLTVDDRNDRPSAWTSDSRSVLFSSDRNGTWDIFRQAIDSDNAEPLVTGPEWQTDPRLTPDGDAILYTSSRGDPFENPVRLMRVRLSGGVPETVVNSAVPATCRCSESGCLLEERSGDQRLVFSLDPVRGRGRQIFRRPRDGGETVLSRDGKLAYIRPDAGVIRLVRMSDGSTEREIEMEGARFLNSLNWTADGKGFYAASGFAASGAALVRIDLNGKWKVLWNQAGTRQLWSVPSPNGKHLAILGSTRDSNVWLLENF